METILKTLTNQENAILESPTGTGKSISLLCAILAFLKQIRQAGNKKTKIMYFSRTHYQLKQVIKELKNTAYIPKIITIGGRDYTCTNPLLDKLYGKIKKIKCLDLVSKNKCRYYSNYMNGREIEIEGIYDLDDMVREGRDKGVCGFHFSKRFEQCDLVFLPFYYAMDFIYRETHANLISDSILVFDEAHNIQDVSEEGASLNFFLEDFNVVSVFLSEFLQQDLVDEEKMQTKIMDLLTIFTLLYENLCESYGYMKNTTIIENGTTIFTILEKFSKITTNKKTKKTTSLKNGINSKNLIKIINILEKTINDTKQSENFSYSSSSKSITSVDRLLTFLKLTNNLWSDNQKSLKNTQTPLITDFKIRITITKQSINFDIWCLNPSFTFKKILNLNPHSIILTSGTLSPLNLFQQNIGIEFQNIYKGDHVIDKKKQVFSGLVTHMANRVINMNFVNRSNKKMILTIGGSIAKIVKVVPEGVLVFFSSYSVMNLYVGVWRKEGVFETVQREKEIFVEGKNSREERGKIERYVQRHRSGAIYFAVSGGKLSEGIDFSDSMARCVIVLGLPFPNVKDEKLIAKKNFLNFKNENERGGRKIRFTGENWLEAKAIKKTNQAIGRVIRHRNDYGAILFFDIRFKKKSIKNIISKWAVDNLIEYREEDKLVEDLRQFFVDVKLFVKERIENQKKEEIILVKEKEKKFNDNYDVFIDDGYEENYDLSNYPVYDQHHDDLEEPKEKEIYNFSNSFKKKKENNNSDNKNNDLEITQKIKKEKISELKENKKKKNIIKNNKNKIFPIKIENSSSKKHKINFSGIKQKLCQQIKSLQKKNPKKIIKKKIKKNIKIENKIVNNSKNVNMCPICYEPLKNEYSSKCGHIACKKCWFDNIKNNKKCFICRKDIKSTKLLIKLFYNNVNL